jgi:hypothetical protein
VWEFSNLFPWVPGTSLYVRVGVLAAWVSVASLFVIAVGQRFLLRALLADKTFLYAARKPTLWLKVWFVLVRALTRGKPMLYSFQVC